MLSACPAYVCESVQYTVSVCVRLRRCAPLPDK